MTLFIAVPTCDVSHHLPWIRTFSKRPLIKRQKKFLEDFSFCTIYRLFAHLGFFNPKRNVLGQKKEKRRKIWRQLPFRAWVSVRPSP